MGTPSGPVELLVTGDGAAGEEVEALELAKREKRSFSELIILHAIGNIF
jgi:hypothetical protein